MPFVWGGGGGGGRGESLLVYALCCLLAALLHLDKPAAADTCQQVTDTESLHRSD